MHTTRDWGSYLVPFIGGGFVGLPLWYPTPLTAGLAILGVVYFLRWHLKQSRASQKIQRQVIHSTSRPVKPCQPCGPDRIWTNTAGPKNPKKTQ